MKKYGLIQGRLTPSNGRGIQFFPFENWKKEFHLANKLGISNIEWVFDYEDYEKNPIWQTENLNNVKEVIDENNVEVKTLCFDYFMRRPFFKNNSDLIKENMNFLQKIVNNLYEIGGENIEIPLVDNASIKTNFERRQMAKFLNKAAEDIPSNMHLILESDLNSEEFNDFLDNANSERILVNYDVGDRVGCGFQVSDDVKSLINRIENVHIKDKKTYGVTVPLGTGDTNFDALFMELKKGEYGKNITLQAARGKDGYEFTYVQGQIKFINIFYEKYFGEGLNNMICKNNLDIYTGGGIYSIGIMQGRLTPSCGRGIQFFPFNEWEKEFYESSKIGISEIEWIFDYENYAKNPIWTYEGCKKICEIIEKTGINIRAICFDYFMRQPFYKNKSSLNENLSFFSQVIKGMKIIGASLIEIPLVDDSSIQTTKERDMAINMAREMADIAAEHNIIVGFETDMPPKIFVNFLKDIKKINIAANYDSGNSSGCGYDVREEIEELKDFIANIHIKDRVFKGGTVALGNGSADFDSLFSSLKRINYNKSFILQAARGEDGREKENILSQVKFIKDYIYKIGA